MLAALPRLKDRLEAALAPLDRFEFFNSRFETDPLHILLAAKAARAEDLFEFCVDRGIFLKRSWVVECFSCSASAAIEKT